MRVALGSAVVVAPHVLATNCHVTAGAARIAVVDNDEVSPATRIYMHAGRDMCLLHAPAVKANPVSAARSVVSGQAVFALGYPAANRLSLSEGGVIALHDYDDGKVIQVSAPFDYGASGGGLFDESGALLGLLTFKAMAGGAYHFVTPVRWIQDAMRGDKGDTLTLPFWQTSREQLPYFLQAASMEALGNWSGLHAVAKSWLKHDPDSPSAARALATARMAKSGTSVAVGAAGAGTHLHPTSSSAP